MSNLNFKIGIGYDIHRLEANRDLIIGGVKIPYEKGLLGHSDADVLTHAVIDALLGAAGMPDIGTLFPDDDPEYAGADSMKLLEKVYIELKEKGFRVNNLDTNIIAQAPKLMPYVPEIRESLAFALELNTEDVSVKAKTHEHLDSIGEGNAIEAQAVVLIYKV